MWWATMATGRIVGRLLMDGWDTSLVPGTQHHSFPSPPQPFMRKIAHSRSNILIGTFSNMLGVGQTLSDGGGFQEYDLSTSTGAWTWVNETTVDVRLAIGGGFGTTIDFSYDGGTTWQAGKIFTQAVAAPFPRIVFDLRPGEAVRVNTTTTAPSAAAFPLL
jgi:hypothetical protein